MNTFDFDLFVIGAGSGGVRAARMAAQLGARVAVAEAAALGGTCVNVGCIPKKLYSFAAGYAEAFEEAQGYGWHIPGQPHLDWEQLKQARAKEISRLNGVYARLLENSGATLLNGWAQVIDAHTVEVGGRQYRAQHTIIAAGGTPYVPEIPGREFLLTSDDIFDAAPLPKRLVVIGGGYIACEFASIFTGLGARVTQLHRGPHLLNGFDADVRQFLASEMGKAGVDIQLNTMVAGIEKSTDGGYKVMLERGQHVEADVVLCATGRVPNTRHLGLLRAGISVTEKGAIQVDAQYRTSIPSIHAVGDVSASVQLTPVALAQAMVVVDGLFGKKAKRLDYEFIPTAVFTHPNIGTCGYTEHDARAKFGEVTIFSTEFKPLRHTLSGRSERTFMKLVVEKATDRVVGLHVVGADAGEMVQGFAVAMRAGATKAIFDSTVGIHPTAAEELVTMREPAPSA